MRPESRMARSIGRLITTWEMDCGFSRNAGLECDKGLKSDMFLCVIEGDNKETGDQCPEGSANSSN